MESSSTKKGKGKAAVSTPAVQERALLANSASPATVHIRQPLYTATPALKAARTRARRTLEGFSQEETEVLFPAASFVRLKISREALSRSDVPLIRTRWEELRSQYIRLNKDQLWARPAITIDAQDQSMNEKAGINFGNTSEVAHVDKNVAHVADTKEALGQSTNQGWEPRQAGYASEASKGNFQAPADLTLLPHNHAVNETEPLIVSSTSIQSKQASSDQSSAKGIHKSGANPLLQGELASRVEPPQHSQHRLAAESQNRGSDLLEDRLAHSRPTPKRKINSLSDRKDDRLSPSAEGDEVSVEAHAELVQSNNSNNQSHQTLSSHLHDRSPEAGQATSRESRTRYPKSPGFVTGAEDHQSPHHFTQAEEVMAPVRDPNSVETSLKDAIQKLYEIQSQVHGFVPETQPLLVEKMTELAQALAHIQTLTSTALSPNNPIHKNRIAPEVIDYVDDSRNPDIYNREFVELVQRGNAVMNGKQQAFRDFSHMFADALREGIPELKDDVDRIMENARLAENKMNAQRAAAATTSANGAPRTEKKSNAQGEGESSANGARNV